MESVRRPAVAGMFYPDNPKDLRSLIAQFMAAVPAHPSAAKAIIAPHAGYIYSGPVAASAYAELASRRSEIRRVVLIGPSHRVPLLGLAVSTAQGFGTPLGVVPVDQEAIAAILDLPQVQTLDRAHAREHSLEVHLPFLQAVLESFAIVPLVVGDVTAQEVGEVLERLWGGPETVIVVSSDLSHYHDYETARALDKATTQAIEALRGDLIGPEEACGCVPIAGLLTVAPQYGLSVRTLDLCNSGDTAGPRDRVVGYGAYALEAAVV